MGELQLDVLEGQYTDIKTDVLVLGLFEEEALNPPIKYFDERLNGLLSKAFQKKNLTGEYKQIKVYPVNTKPENLIIIGLGKKSAWNIERLRCAAAVSAKAARQLGKSFTTNLQIMAPGAPEANAKAVALGTALGLYQFNKYKTRELDKIKNVEHVVLIDTEKQKTEFSKGASEGMAIAESVNITRDLVNTTSNELTPKVFASEAKRILKPLGCSITTWDKRDMEKKGMGAIVGVAKGSDEEPQFIIIEYGPKKMKPIVLVGKGVTFDTGGLSIKYPYTAMLDMKSDMAGGAAVIGAIRALAALKVQQRVIGIIPAVENAINGKAQKPGDIVKAMNGKTIEVINTDAEGRLILADSLCYAETLQPQAIIDLATLTGACMVALGYHNAGLFTRSDTLKARLLEASKTTNDKAWQLPLTDDYVDLVRSDIADVRNLGKDAYAGAIVGAVFLEKFVDKTPWAHLDIAGTAWHTEEREYTPKGATGAGVRLIVETLQKWETIE